MSNAKRFNEGKVDYTLIPLDALKEEALVWMAGEQKYPNEVPLTIKEITKLCSAQNAIKINKLDSLPEYVIRAIQNPAENLLPVLSVVDKLPIKAVVDVVHAQNDIDYKLFRGPWNEKELDRKEIMRDINCYPKINSNNVKESTQPHLRLEDLGIKKLINGIDYKNSMDFLKNNILLTQVGDVLSVESLNAYTLTIAIPQENTEVYCVVIATKESDCLKIIVNILSGLHIISQSIEIIDNNILLNKGRGNWEALWGKDTPRVVGASALRHLLAYLGGQDIDPETGFHHLAHLRCNCAMGIRYSNQRREVNNDNTTQD